MLQLRNTSPFAASLFGIPDQRGVDTLIVVVKASFCFGDPPSIAPEQVPVVLADEYWGAPESSSLRYPSEVHFGKPGADVLVLGEARAPRDQPVTELEVSVRVGDRSKRARVHGDRYWTEGVRGLQPSRAQPFVRMPLIYERAFGGQQLDRHGRTLADPRNPVGVGFLGERHPSELLGHPVPNLDDPDHPLERLGQAPPPVGFGALAPSWAPRLDYAGTYDERWRKLRAPLLPEDFDPRYFHAGAEGLRFDEPLRGGEPVLLDGLDPDRRWQFTVPRCELEIVARIAGEARPLRPVLETVLLEPEARRFCLSWRASSRVAGQLLRVERVSIGLASVEGVAERGEDPA
ncbi:MAG: DUF2169 domain-containing protein [Enhygromyxa sp.]